MDYLSKSTAIYGINAIKEVMFIMQSRSGNQLLSRLYARKWIAHEKYQNKSQDSTENSCGKFKVLEICPKSTIETDCKGNEFFCHKSKSRLDTAKICDGIVHCIFGVVKVSNCTNPPFLKLPLSNAKKLIEGAMIY